MRHKKTNAEGTLAAYQAMYRTAPSSADFHNNCYEAGDKKLWDECVAEEKAENERALAPIKAAQDAVNKTMIAALANELLTIPNDPFLAEHCKQTEIANALEDIASAFLEFREMTLPTVITDAGIALLERITMQNLGVDWASTSPLSFAVLWARLDSLGLIREGLHKVSPEPQARREPQELTAREQCEAEYVNTVLPLMAEWESSLLENWGITLTPRLRETVSDIMRRHNLNPAQAASYDFVRVQLAKRLLIKTNRYEDGRPLTRDERISDAIDTQNINLSSPEGQDWYRKNMDLLIHSEDGF
jgi:hypothetical protein